MRPSPLRAVAAIALVSLLLVAACGAPGGARERPATSRGPERAVATVIPGWAPLGGPDRPPESPRTGGPIPSYGLPSPFLAEGQASLAPRPTLRPGAGEIVTFEISPADYFNAVVREGSTLTVFADGSIRIDSIRDQAGDNHVEWALPPELIPDAADVLDVYARGCGWGSGDFYEIYGPWDSTEFEYEVTPPASDGCWHFTQAVGKSYEFEIWLHGDATMTIERLELVVTMRA
jgi:hypothetical protein